MTDNKIKKALECCVGNECEECCFNEQIACREYLLYGAIDLLNRLEKENNDLFRELEGVMWSVDKWLDGDELKQDKVNRAITMREKTLQITEKQEAEIEKLNVELVGMRGACESYKMHYDNAQAEIERSNKNLITISNACKERRNEAIKEFAERLKEKTTYITSHLGNISVLAHHKLINNLVKEMTEVQG